MPHASLPLDPAQSTRRRSRISTLRFDNDDEPISGGKRSRNKEETSIPLFRVSNLAPIIRGTVAFTIINPRNRESLRAFHSVISSFEKLIGTKKKKRSE